ncbi:pyridoxamine 5'-phosphate oxidase family protein [Neolewinella maritima]|nr:pyridoxamine 5'-phosphate oxidase family protein [Neolewinella maritima]
MSVKITSLTLWTQAWRLIKEGAARTDHSYSLVAMANCGAQGIPRQRTVVLRNADEGSATLYTYTDRRSVKASELRQHNVLSYLFWDADSRIQFTGHGPTHWLPEEEARALFDTLPKHSRKAYATVQPPATPIDRPQDGLPDDWPTRAITDTDYAAGHFGVLVTELQYAEVLRLDREHNLRLSGVRTGAEWTLTWLIP